MSIWKKIIRVFVEPFRVGGLPYLELSCPVQASIQEMMINPQYNVWPRRDKTFGKKQTKRRRNTRAS